MSSSMSGYSGFGSKKGGPGDVIPKGYETAQLQQFTPQQMQLHGQQFGQVSPNSYLSKLAGGDQSAFAELEEPAMKQFSALQGNIASRFSAGSGQGSLGNRHSSGFQNQMTASTQDFAGQLASRRMDIRQQAIQDLMGFSNQILNQKPYERLLAEKQKKKKPFWQQALGLISPIGGDIVEGGTENTRGFLSALSGMNTGGSGNSNSWGS